MSKVILRKSGTYTKPSPIPQNKTVNAPREFMPSWNVADVQRYSGKHSDKRII